MSLDSNQSLVSYSLCLCPKFDLAHLIIRTCFGLKVLWALCCPYPSTGSPASLLLVVIWGIIYPTVKSLSDSHTHRFSGATSPHPSSLEYPRNVPPHQFPLFLSCSSTSDFPDTVPFLSSLLPSSPLQVPLMIILFPLLRFEHPQLCLLSCLASLRSLECNTGIL